MFSICVEVFATSASDAVFRPTTLSVTNNLTIPLWSIQGIVDDDEKPFIQLPKTFIHLMKEDFFKIIKKYKFEEVGWLLDSTQPASCYQANLSLSFSMFLTTACKHHTRKSYAHKNALNISRTSYRCKGWIFSEQKSLLLLSVFLFCSNPKACIPFSCYCCVIMFLTHFMTRTYLVPLPKGFFFFCLW